MKKIIVFICLLMISNYIFAMGHSYEHVYKPDSRYKLYTIHRFTFNYTEYNEIRNSPKDAQPYANQVLKLMWEVNGFGEKNEYGWRDISKVFGGIYLAFKLNSIAQDYSLTGDYMEIRFKSRRDKGGRIGLEIWDSAADFWKTITGN